MLLRDLKDDLARCGATGLRRSRIVIEGAQGARVRVAGREYLAFCSNDYLGLANHPALAQAACDAAREFGVGAGASHLITGHSVAHQRLEERLAAFVGLPRALLFSTGYMANLGVVATLAGRGDTVFSDKLNHASLIDAVRLSRAEATRYPHLDLAALEKRLAASSARRKLIVTDGVFSMDGDLAPLPELIAFCERHDAWLLVDDAHGFGVLGRGGRGILSHFGVRSPRAIYLGTLGKAAGVFGAFVAGAPEIIETLVQRARTYIYTTALPPLLAAAVSASLELIESEDWRRQRLAELIARLKAGLKDGAWRLLPSTTPIQPLVVGDNRRAVALAAGLRERGILVPAIRPPTVPEGSARLRVSLSAAHAPEDVDRLLDALRDLEGTLPLHPLR
ncbi:MAG: 8-amino-7-oxononanoate synthase [Betaproteobacteria bacterium]|nr:8-amino-7-oxononanoate synthase [Betaproteobacteria bacterium]